MAGWLAGWSNGVFDSYNCSAVLMWISNVDTWDAHDSIVDNHGQHALEVDKPIAGLNDRPERWGLLDETLVLWHTEFGRMPISQRGVGRDR